MSHTWIRKLFERLVKPQTCGKTRRNVGRSRLKLEALESRLTPSGAPPTAAAIPRLTVNEDSSAVTLNLGTYFTDPELDLLTYSVVQTNSTGLITPSIAGANLTLSFAPNQFGYSYFRVTANDGTGSTTAAFEVLVNAVDELASDIAATSKTATIAINVLGNDGVGDSLRTAEAANIQVVQNDTANATTSVTVTIPQGTPDLLIRNGSNRADYNIQIGASALDDVANGLLFSSIRENVRDNLETTSATLAGPQVMTSAIDSDATGYWIPVFNAADGSEYNVNPAAAYFPFSQGWIGGWAVNAAGTNGGPNDQLRNSTPNSGLDIGTTANFLVQDQGSGRLRVRIPGVNSTTDGLLLALGGKNEDNYAMGTANADGSWQIVVRDNGSNGTNPAAGNEQDYAAFVYIPRGVSNVVSGRILGNGSVELGSGNFTVNRTATGTYELAIPGQSPTSGILLLSPEGGTAITADNFVTYQASGNNFVINSWDITNSADIPTLQDAGATERMASFVFIPFLNVPALRTTGAQSVANGANRSELGATLSVNPDGTVSYDPTTSAVIQALPVGQILVDTFTYTTTSLAGVPSTATVNVTIGQGHIVDLVNGVLSITSTPGIASNLSVAFDGTNYSFNDPAAVFTLTPAAALAFSGSGTNTIVGNSTAVSSLLINTGDLDDTITLNGLNDSFSIAGGGQTGDTVAVAGALTFTGDATINNVASITASGVGKIITPLGTVNLTAANFIGTSLNNVLTQAATIHASSGIGGVFLTEDDGGVLTATAATDGSITLTNVSGVIDITANATGLGNISLTSLDGTLNIAGQTSTATGNITLSSGDAITLSANLVTASGLIAISANTDGLGSEGFDQLNRSIVSGNTTGNALTINVNTATGTGNAILGPGLIGSSSGGTVNVLANGGSILWSSAYVIPSIATSNASVLRAHSYAFSATGATSAIGSLAAPIQTDNFVDFGTANLAAGGGGIYFTDWGSPDLVFENVVAQGAGDIQLISANAGGHNLSLINVTTGSGNITLIADDDLFVGSLNNAPVVVPGFIGGPSFSGTISMRANRDDGNEQRILMRPGSVIETTNTSANAILMQTTATDNSSSDLANLGGITLTTVKAGDGGTITLDVSPTATHRGNIIQQDDTTIGLDAGPTGTVILNAWNELNGPAPANNASIGDAVSPIRINAGNIIVTSKNTPVRIAAVGSASVTATVTAVGLPTVAAGTLTLSSETGVLTIGGATNTDGAPISISASAGIVVNGVLGDASSGDIAINAGGSDVVVNSNLTVNVGQTVTVTDGNFAQLGPFTTVNGTLIALNGVEVGSGDLLQGSGTISGPVLAATGSTVAPGNSPAILSTGAATVGGTLAIELNGPVAGSGYDQLNVTGPVDITGSTLDLSLNFVPTIGEKFVIVNSDTGITGTFSNTFPLAAGVGVFSVNYAGGVDGFDVELTVVNVRPSASFDSVTPNPRSTSYPTATLTFSEAVTGFDLADLSLTRDGVPVPLVGVTIGGSGPTYTINGLSALTNDIGAYELTLTSAGSGIQDLDTPVGALAGDAVVTWVRSNNSAPVLDATGTMTLNDILEDEVANNGTLVSDIIASAGGDRITDTTNDPEGIAVIAADSAHGTWEFSTNNGAAWNALGPVSDTLSLLLAADTTTRVRFIPSADFIGKVASGLTFRAWDQTTGTNGGVADTTSNGSSTSFSTVTETASIYVINLPDVLTANFQDGLNNYAGTSDTQLSQEFPDDTLYGTDDPLGGLLVDWAATGESNAGHVLLRYDGLFGDGPGQIPVGSIIVSAVLTLTTNNSGAGGAFHRLNTPWDEASDTWNTFGSGLDGRNTTGGVQANGSEANRNFYSYAGPPNTIDQNTGTGRTAFGVTADLQAWSNGEANNGWAILPWTNGTDGWAFRSSEAFEQLDRPLLSVKYLPAGSVSVANLRQGVNGYTGTVDTELRQPTPDASGDLRSESFVDYTDGNNNETQALLRFNDLIGSTPTSVPAGANVAAGTLILPSVGGSAPGDGGTFNRMLVDWNGADTWNTFASGTGGRNATAGVQADGVEAATVFNFQAGNVSRTPDAQATAYPFDATADVQAWVKGGAPNYGWAGLPWNLGSNGWSFNQSEVAAEALRPQLLVYYSESEREFATLDVTAGALTFVGGGGEDAFGIANNLTISLVAGNYVFNDPNGIITLSSGAIAAGWTGSGMNTVTGPSSNVSSLAINTGTKNDTVTLAGADDPISINGGNSGLDVLNLTGSITTVGTVSLSGFSSINRTAGTITAGTLYLSAGTIGSSGNRIQTAATNLYMEAGPGGAFVTEADDLTLGWATATGTGPIAVATSAGVLTVAGSVRSEAGAITLTGATEVAVNAAIGDTLANVTTGDITIASQNGNLTIGAPLVTAGGNISLTATNAVTLNVSVGNTTTMTGTITIAANTDGAGSEGFTQTQGFNLQTANTTANAVSISVNTALGGTGDAVLGASNVAGTLTVSARGGNILWGAVVDPVLGNNPINGGAPATLRAGVYALSTTSPTGSIGTSLIPIQTDALSNTSIATLAAGDGGIYLTDWGASDLTITSATATGAGNVVLIAAAAGGSNLTVVNASTATGNIFLAADDSLFIGDGVGGVIGGPGFSGTITLIGNRDDGNEQTVTMNAGSSLVTSNATAAAVSVQLRGTDGDVTDATFPTIVVGNIATGIGGTVSVNTSPTPTTVGSITQLAGTTINTGATGTVAFNVRAGQNGVDPALGAGIGAAGQPVVVNAGTVTISSINSPVFVATTGAASFTAAVTAVGTETVLAGATLSLATQAGALTIAGATSTPGAAIDLNGFAGVVLNAALGNSTNGAISITGPLSGASNILAGAGLVTLTQNTASTYGGVISGAAPVTKAGSGALTLSNANLYTGATQIVAGSLIVNSTNASSGFTVSGTGTLGGSGTVGPVLAAAGGSVAPGASPGKLNTGGFALNTGSNLKIELNGTTVGTQYDQVNVTGSANINADTLTGATLSVSVGYGVVIGDTFTIINNDSNDPIAGTFNGLADLSTFVADGITFRITYFGGTGGNDVVLTAVTGSAANPPQVVGVTVNGNIPALAGVQRSRVASLQVAFNQPVQIDNGAFSLALRANNLGLGSLPTTLNSATTDGGTTWVLTFSGNTEPSTPGADGFQSIKDGVYDLNVNTALVHPLGNPGVSGTGTSTSTFHRLFGDGTGEQPPAGNAHITVVDTADNGGQNGFRASFNTPANYKAWFDFDGDGLIVTGDNFQFRNRFNRPLIWNT